MGRKKIAAELLEEKLAAMTATHVVKGDDGVEREIRNYTREEALEAISGDGSLAALYEEASRRWALTKLIAKNATRKAVEARVTAAKAYDASHMKLTFGDVAKGDGVVAAGLDRLVKLHNAEADVTTRRETLAAAMKNGSKLHVEALEAELRASEDALTKLQASRPAPAADPTGDALTKDDGVVVFPPAYGSNTILVDDTLAKAGRKKLKKKSKLKRLKKKIRKLERFVKRADQAIARSTPGAQLERRDTELSK